MGFTFEGLAELERRLKEAEETIGKEAAKAVEANIEEIFEETQRRVPQKTGALKESGRIEWKDRGGDHPEATIKYGNSEVDRVGVFYAAAVHEIMDARHDPPTGPKYVELPLIEGEEKFKRALAKAAAKSLGKKTL